MPTVRIEHKIHDFEAWKQAFDRDPANRRKLGVHRYKVLRAVDDPNYIMIDLDFDEYEDAEKFVSTMRSVWRSPQAASVLHGSPQVRIVEVVESCAL